MKNFVKFLVVALAVSMIAGMFAFSASAVATEPGVDPRELKPGSDRVIFIQDAPRDPETNEIIGEIPGDGSGTSPENPLIPLEHGDFNAEAQYPKYHLTTAFYQATEMLKETGGTIVITGPVYFGRQQCYGSSNNVADVFTAEFKNNVIKFTSVYNGVDYRETNGAKITIEKPAMISVIGSSIWENIDVETIGTGRAITFDEYATLVGEGMNCYPKDELLADVAQGYVSLAGGHRYAKSKGENPTLVVQSGTYNVICGGVFGAVATSGMEEANVNLTIEGTTKVMGIVSGSVNATAPFGGDINITINGGVFECDINAVGSTGFTNNDGTATLTINGGDFSNAWSINAADVSNTGNPPLISIVDFSGWTGDDVTLAYAALLAAAEDAGFTTVKLPEGKTVEDLEAAINNGGTEEPDPTETTEAEGSAKPEDTTAKKEESTTTAKKDDKTTTAPATTTAAAPVNNEGGFPIGIIIAIVAVVAVAVVAVVIVMKKKGSKK